MNVFIRLLYSILIAVSVVVFVGFGLETFFPGPKPPDYSYDYGYNKPSEVEIKRQQSDQEKAYKEFESKQKAHSQKLTIVSLPLAAAVVVAGLLILKRNEVVGEGIALGGVATSIYSIIQSSIADARVLRFVAVTLFLASTLLVARQRFLQVKPAKK